MSKHTPLQLLALMTPYSAAVSVAYLWGFWGVFNVDVFAYVTASDLVVISIVPFLGVGVFALIGVALGSISAVVSEKLEARTDRLAKVSRATLRGFDKFSIGVCLVFLFFGGPHKWIVIPVFLTLVLFMLVVGVVAAHGTKDVSRQTLVLLFVAILLPAQALGMGRFNALRIQDGSSCQLVEYKNSQELVQLRYLGKLGGFIFLLNPDDEVVVETVENATPFHLTTKISGAGVCIDHDAT